MTTPKLLSAFQSALPDLLPRHMRRRITLSPGGCWDIASAAAARYRAGRGEGA